MSEHAGIQLQDKVVVITGASRGIGEAVAHTLAAAGAKIVVASRKQESVDAVAAAIRAAGGDALAVAAHTGDDEAVRGLIDTTVATFGQVDVLINNAATNPHFGPIMTAETSHWDKTFDVNIKGYFRTARAVLPVMQRQGGGKIINV
ncbi:MAG: SDR family NAD(P)-dependent oxidoreductase, partial [Caldilineaceae bacterium]|nr:SDR family NAD(P)-dependent oxidoreductase [Caldilineaceae bacterium]